MLEADTTLVEKIDESTYDIGTSMLNYLVKIENLYSLQLLMEQDQPFFSIIIPTYGRAERLAIYLESLANLDTLAIPEVIVVSEFSTDKIALTCFIAC